MKLSIIILCLNLAANSAGSFDKARFAKEARGSDIVIIAQVVEIRPSIITFWSGTALCWQTVRYKIKEVLKGNVEVKIIDVGHLIAHNSLTADKENPRLSPVLFRPGNRLVVMLSSKTKEKCSGIGEPSSDVKRLCSHDENYGATLATDETVGLVRKAINDK